MLTQEFLLDCHYHYCNSRTEFYNISSFNFVIRPAFQIYDIIVLINFFTFFCKRVYLQRTEDIDKIGGDSEKFSLFLLNETLIIYDWKTSKYIQCFYNIRCSKKKSIIFPFNFMQKWISFYLILFLKFFRKLLFDFIYIYIYIYRSILF